MKKQFKTLAAATTLGIASLAICGTSLANNATPPAGPQAGFPGKHAPAAPLCKKKAKTPWNLGLQFDKHLTAGDAKTLVSAALLMQGRHDLVVGKVEPKAAQNNRTLYLVTIQDSKGTAVTTVVVNSQSGHIRPLADKPHKSNKPSRK